MAMDVTHQPGRYVVGSELRLVEGEGVDGWNGKHAQQRPSVPAPAAAQRVVTRAAGELVRGVKMKGDSFHAANAREAAEFGGGSAYTWSARSAPASAATT